MMKASMIANYLHSLLWFLDSPPFLQHVLDSGCLHVPALFSIRPGQGVQDQECIWVRFAQDPSRLLRYFLVDPGRLHAPALISICQSQVVHNRERIWMLVSQDPLSLLRQFLVDLGCIRIPSLSFIRQREVRHVCERIRVFVSYNADVFVQISRLV